MRALPRQIGPVPTAVLRLTPVWEWPILFVSALFDRILALFSRILDVVALFLAPALLVD